MNLIVYYQQVGRVDLRLISPDRKQVLFHKQLKDIASCVQGIKNSEHFGFICREAAVDCFIGYIFKCQSASVADDLVGGKLYASSFHQTINQQKYKILQFFFFHFILLP